VIVFEKRKNNKMSEVIACHQPEPEFYSSSSSSSSSSRIGGSDGGGSGGGITQTKAEIHGQSPDALLAYELNQLSFHERNTINEEVHGVRDSDYPEETTQLLNDSLLQLEKELHKIKHKPAFDLAQEKYGSGSGSGLNTNSNTTNTNSNTNTNGDGDGDGDGDGGTYINTEKFRLIFLRCEIFNIKKAAERIIAFLELSYEICGEYALYRYMLLSDFDSKSLKFIKAGYFQNLPGRDRSGRRVIGNFSGDYPKQHKINDRVSLLLYVRFRFRFRALVLVLVLVLYCTILRVRVTHSFCKRKATEKTDGDRPRSQSVRN
jgi:hypothetical protein